MTERIDQKEDMVGELCDRYGLDFQYAWGKYFIAAKVDYGATGLFDSNSVLTFSRHDLSGWDKDEIEGIVLGYVLLEGF